MDPRYARSTYSFHLPDDRIAQVASHPPESAKMLVFEREADDASNSGVFEDLRFSDLPELAGAGRLFVFNDTRVIPSRVAFSGAVFTNRDGFRREKAGEIFFLREIPGEKGGVSEGEADSREPSAAANNPQAGLGIGSVPPAALRDAVGPEPIPRPRTFAATVRENPSQPRFEALVFPGAAFSVGSTIELGDFTLEVESKVPDGRILRIVSGGSVHDFLSRHGKLPLPPYVEYSDEKARDYQTDFAKKEGSLAAPTASLHFTEALISKIREKGSTARFLTLHVGLGTFQPVRVEDIREHEMHPERFEVPHSIFSDVVSAKSEGKKVVGVGTTVIRTLESLPYVWRELRRRAGSGDAACAEFLGSFSEEASDFWNLAADALDPEYAPAEVDPVSESGISGATRLFLMPGSRFHVVDEIVTNFHLPESTLLVLVSAFAGMEKARAAYEHALSKDYRFYSF